MPDLIQTDLRLLVCPICRHSLPLDVNEIRCGGCGRRYPIVDGIPILLADRVLP